MESSSSISDLQIRATSGDTEAIYKLGECYRLGVGVTKNDAEAISLFMRAAEGGCINAMSMLGLCYSKGHGVEQDMEAAFQWYRKAAQSGDVASMVMLADCFCLGHGVKKNVLETVKWLRRATKKGDFESRFRLGVRLINGDGVTKDKVEGLYLIRLAAENGHMQAVECLIEMADKNDTDAQYHLGWLYATGKGVACDAAMAARLFVKSMASHASGKEIAEVLADHVRGDADNACWRISNLKELAVKNGISLANLMEMVQHKDRYYKRIVIPKSKSGLRKIDAPRRKLKHIQRAILSKVLREACPSKFATAYVEKKGLKANLDPHVANRYFLCLDIRHFFCSIKFDQIFLLFVSLGCSPYVADALARLCSFREYLPQGSPTSPSISNLIMKPFDEKVSKFCQEQGFAFTRYADDMTFSSNDKNLKEVIPVITQHLLGFGFKLNRKKTRLMGREVVA